MGVPRIKRKLPRFGSSLFITALLLTISVAAFGGSRQLTPSVAQAAAQCTNDTAGANDEPGQKDLTQMCVDYSGAPTSISVQWNWDEISVNGANTLDACSLYDTDGDGNVNYALCVTSTDGVSSTTRLYSCGDDKSDRCTSPVVEITSFSSTCSVSVQNSDPFPAGSQSPKDLVASCTVALADVGATSAQLVDVCSYPSQQPNSDPSDCVVLQNNSGKLEVRKVVVPTDASQFNLQIDATTKATGGNGTTTGEVVVSASNGGTTHTVGETAAAGTSLGDYTSSIECRTLNGTGSVVASSSSTGPLNVPVHLQEDIVCVITNTHVATPTPTSTNTPTNSPTNTPTNTATATDTPTNTPVPPTSTPTNTPTNTATATNTPTNTPAGSGCTFTQGYWKNHPSAWPVSSLTIGGITYTEAQLITILQTPPKGDATYILIDQLIAALLNQANGASTTAVSQTIVDAQAFLASHPLGSNPSDPDRQQAIDLGAKLDQYNNGLIGPGHCGEEQLTPTSTPIKTNTPTPIKTPTSTPIKTNTPTPIKTPTKTPTPSPAQGCTPGYWKQSQHFDSWPSAYTPDTLLNKVFKDTGKSSSTTLLQALNFKGSSTVSGAKEILLRAAVAALLNSNTVKYPLSTSDVISQVNKALSSDNRTTILNLATKLDGYNNAGCPLN